MKLPLFKCRASALGQIMTNPRSGGGLSETCKTFLENWAREQLYQRRKEFYSKQTDKGNVKEDKSIEYAAEVYGWGLVFKNEDSFENDFFTGTPDIILAQSVEDIKNSWDAFTFPLFDTDVPKSAKGYDWQGRAYMDLTGKETFGLVYTLMNAPEHLVEREAWMITRGNGESELKEALFQEVKEQMSYEHLPDLLRITRFEIEADQFKIAEAKQRVLECREHIEKFIQPKFLKL